LKIPAASPAGIRMRSTGPAGQIALGRGAGVASVNTSRPPVTLAGEVKTEVPLKNQLKRMNNGEHRRTLGYSKIYFPVQ